MFNVKTRQPLILVLLAILCQASAYQTRCDAGVYSTGDNASIVCHFPEKRSFEEKGFTVYEYTNNPTGRAILLCQSRDVSTCEVQVQGYTLEHFTNEELKLEIPHVNKTFEGRYKCHIMSDKELESCDCILTVQDCPAPKTPTGNETFPSNQNGSCAWQIIVTFFITIITVIVLVVFLHACRRKRDGQSEELDGRLLTGKNEDQNQNPALKHFNVEKDILMRLVRVLGREMKLSLDNDKKSSIRMYSTSLQSLPTGKEQGVFIVVELGSTHLIIHLVKLNVAGADSKDETYKIPAEIKHGPAKELFKFIAKRTKWFLKTKNMSKKRNLQMAFVSPFPYEWYAQQTKIRVTKLTNEFHCEGIVQEDLKRMIQEALINKKLTRLVLTVIVDPAVCALMAGAYKDRTCQAAFVLGNGFSACYVEDQSSTEASESDRDKKNIIKAEWGGFGDGGQMDLLKSQHDIELDKYSVNPGKQIFEKMTNKLYVGELVRRELYLDKSISVQDQSSLTKRFGLTPAQISSIQGDHGGSYVCTKKVLQQLGVSHPTEENCIHVHKVCLAVLERAARLTAAGVSVFIDRCCVPKVTVAVSSSTKSEDGFYLEQMQEMTEQLLQVKSKVQIVPVQKGTAIGAAVIAALIR